MKILDGKKIAEEILRNLKKEIRKRRLRLKLAVILVRRDPVSESFIHQQKRACQKVSIDFELFEFSSRRKIEKIAKDPNNSGIVIVGDREFSNLIPPKKNVEKISPVVCAVERLLKEYKISLRGKNVILVGAGRLVGRPVANWLKSKKNSFKIVDEFTKNISSFTKKADIIISGIGKPNLITGDMIKRGVVVIDVGGDVDFQSVSKKASYLTPTLGGVGPVVVACLLQNLVKLNTK